MTTRSRIRSQPARPSSVTTTDARISAIVAYGRRSGRMPGISPRRSGASRGRARRGALGAPERSSLGARLRNRVPQYGHSVMYGDTSEPQLLQTTNRSGPLAIGDRFYADGHGAHAHVPASYSIPAHDVRRTGNHGTRLRRKALHPRLRPPRFVPEEDVRDPGRSTQEETDRIADAKRLIF